MYSGREGLRTNLKIEDGTEVEDDVPRRKIEKKGGQPRYKKGRPEKNDPSGSTRCEMGKGSSWEMLKIKKASLKICKSGVRRCQKERGGNIGTLY